MRVSDPAFKDWLATTRRQMGARSDLVTRPLVHIQTDGTADAMQKDLLSHGIANGIGDWCAMRVATVGHSPDSFLHTASESFSDYLLQARLNTVPNGVSAHVSLTQRDPALSRWTVSAQIQNMTRDPLEDTALFQLINKVADRTIADLAPAHRDTETSRFLTAGTLGAVRSIFRNASGDLEIATRQLQTNFEMQREGIYLAWLAYVTTLEIAERNAQDLQSLSDRARACCAQALELDPYGSMTLALFSYVKSFVLKDMPAGYDLATRAIESNRANPLAWIFRGATHFFQGDGDRAMKDTRFGRRISGEGPYAYVIETFCCAAATCAGRYDEALALAERAAKMAPSYKAPLRYIVAINAARGDIEALRLAIRRLRVIEPDFTIDSLRERKYPVPGMRAAGLVDPD